MYPKVAAVSTAGEVDLLTRRSKSTDGLRLYSNGSQPVGHQHRSPASSNTGSKLPCINVVCGLIFPLQLHCGLYEGKNPVLYS